LKQRLFTPGPTPLPEDVKLSQAREIIHHRTNQFKQVFQEVEEGLKYVFQTNNDVFLFTSSGTGAMEATVANLLSPQDEVLVISGGKFGERWTEIIKAFGGKVTLLDNEWGKGVDPLLVEKKISQNPEIKAVFTQLVETSTGVAYDIETLGNILEGTPAVLVVDAISGLCAQPLHTDKWRVDAVIGGSQKALMIPPGLAFVAISEKAWKLVENSTSPKYYWDFRKARNALAKFQTPYTPAVSLICALRDSLRLLKKEGLEKVVKRHAELAQATREAILAMGLKIFGENPSNVVTSVALPPQIDEKKLRKLMQARFGVQVAGGQDSLAGKIIRIAHLGWMDASDIIVVISALEMALLELGYSVELGKGLRAAEEVFGEFRGV